MSGWFKIGTGLQEIPAGSTVRFIIGQHGTSHTNDGKPKYDGAGGGYSRKLGNHFNGLPGNSVGYGSGSYFDDEKQLQQGGQRNFIGGGTSIDPSIGGDNGGFQLVDGRIQPVGHVAKDRDKCNPGGFGFGAGGNGTSGACGGGGGYSGGREGAALGEMGYYVAGGGGS